MRNTPSNIAFQEGYSKGWRFIREEIECASPYPSSANPHSLDAAWQRGFEMGAQHAQQVTNANEESI